MALLSDTLALASETGQMGQILELLQTRDVRNEIRVREEGKRESASPLKVVASQVHTYTMSKPYLHCSRERPETGSILSGDIDVTDRVWSDLLLLYPELERRAGNSSFPRRHRRRRPRMIEDIVDAYSRVFGAKASPGA